MILFFENEHKLIDAFVIRRLNFYRERKSKLILKLIFDIDGTICPIKQKEEKYEDLVPNKEIVEAMKEYKKTQKKTLFLQEYG